MDDIYEAYDGTTLALSDTSFNGGAVLVDSGRLVGAVNEERLNREKMSTGFPALSIEALLEMADIAPGDVDRVLVADRYGYFKPESRRWEGWLVDDVGTGRSTLYGLSSRLSSFIGNLEPAQQAYYMLKRLVTAPRRQQLPDLLEAQHGIDAPVRFVDHHYCHALAAYYTAGHPEATVITLDGGGDGLCSRVYRVRDGRFELLKKVRSYHSIGNFYAYVTQICGFTAHKHEGKITGLSARGEPVYRDLLEELIGYEDDQIVNRGNCYFWAAVEKLEEMLPADFRHEDLAASIQEILEDYVVRYCDHWVRESGIGHVALAGGVFGNVRLNQFIHELPSVRSVFVHPGMGDGGLAFGAAHEPLARWDGAARPPASNGGPDRPLSAGEPIPDVYLGPGHSERAMESSLDARGLDYTREENVERRIAELLADGMVVARYDGRMEYGPRALGNRSILYQPTDPSVNDWLNQKLDRTEFMPFAPAARMEDADRCFHGVDGARHTAQFMTITFDCTERMKRECPGVVHVDGTARPQLVTSESNPSFHRVLGEYREITGLPCIINTSFNMHEEPIVNTPEEAVRGFLAADLDYLAMGDFVVRNPAGVKRRPEPTSESSLTATRG